ncbi:MAG: helix-turn-helix domain-containing protein [Deltaproteobacteria bacterium]|nr:helix-turn-helix domain-containing protein [Deltaproteobacteria bacterium]MBW2253448.1 helix-turn-helix domain-containing protein [Deltaproteobacteria bacterium]
MSQPPSARGESVDALAARRAERGLTLEQASKATRIPVAHLTAIEEGRFDDLPPGPYRRGQVRAYFAWLGLEPGPEVLDGASTSPPGAPTGFPLWTVRIAAGAVCVVLVVLLVGQFVGRGGAQEEEVVPIADGPDQVVRLVARRTTHLKVIVDGEVVLDRQVPGGEEIRVAGHERVEVHLEGADTTRVEYNGDLIVPQGRQDVPRRLVFIDDLEPED